MPLHAEMAEGSEREISSSPAFLCRERGDQFVLLPILERCFRALKERISLPEEKCGTIIIK